MIYKHIVYKTTNLVNNKIYIGVHRTRIDKNDPYIGCGIYNDKSANKSHPFHKAVIKYGYNNFRRETLFEYPDTEDGRIQAYKKEAEIVNRDFLKRKDVYNVCLDGKVPSSIHERSVVQYDLNGNFIKVWNSMSEAKQIAPTQSISYCCIKNTYSGKWQWRYYNGNTYNILPAKTKRKIVYQFDLLGNYIKSYSSSHDAERGTGISYKIIWGNCMGYQSCAGGYFWSFKNKFEFDPSKIRKSSVACYTDNGEFITSFNSIKEAAEKYQISHSSIIRCINGRCKHAGKVRWKYFTGDTSNITSL